MVSGVVFAGPLFIEIFLLIELLWRNIFIVEGEKNCGEIFIENLFDPFFSV